MQCFDAAAFEAAAALDAYETELMALHEDPRRVALIQRELKRVCRHCMRVPQLTGASTALLLAHHRLLAQLARTGGNDGATAGSPGLQEVRQCVLDLQRACRELFLAPHLH